MLLPSVGAYTASQAHGRFETVISARCIQCRCREQSLILPCAAQAEGEHVRVCATTGNMMVAMA